MRIGMNPLADTVLPPLPEVVAAVITHLPHRRGYHKQRFEVIRTCLASLSKTFFATEQDTKSRALYVWDNGSDDDFRDWLRYDVRPDFLTLSHNVGKATARTAILRSFPPETVIAMSDDDIYFYPNWLAPQMMLLESFPNVGAVSGCPIRTQFRWGTRSTLAWADQNATLCEGRYILDEWEYDYCQSIGRDYFHHMDDTANEVDALISYHGLQAFATAHHMQFVGYAGRLAEASTWSDRAMREEQRFDVAIDKLGYLRLTTTERLTRHIGNVPEKVGV